MDVFKKQFFCNHQKIIRVGFTISFLLVVSMLYCWINGLHMKGESFDLLSSHSTNSSEKKKLGKISYYICCFCSSYIASFFPIFIFYRKRLNEQFCLCLLWENNESNYKIYYLEYNSCF